eukprot:144742-Pyramimonas_sp.AAC.3
MSRQNNSKFANSNLNAVYAKPATTKGAAAGIGQRTGPTLLGSYKGVNAHARLGPYPMMRNVQQFPLERGGLRVFRSGLHFMSSALPKLRCPSITHNRTICHVQNRTRITPGGSKLAVPKPVNLPSIKKEHAGNDPTTQLVPTGAPSSGWKTEETQPKAPSQEPNPAGQINSALAHPNKAIASGTNLNRTPVRFFSWSEILPLIAADVILC